VGVDPSHQQAELKYPSSLNVSGHRQSMYSLVCDISHEVSKLERRVTWDVVIKHLKRVGMVGRK
jgi:hypothetical protein